MAFIWFPTEIGAFTAMIAKRPFGRIASETPVSIMSVVGWLGQPVELPLLAYLLVR